MAGRAPAAGSRPARTQPATVAASGRPTAMARRCATGTLPNRATARPATTRRRWRQARRGSWPRRPPTTAHSTRRSDDQPRPSCAARSPPMRPCRPPPPPRRRQRQVRHRCSPRRAGDGTRSPRPPRACARWARLENAERAKKRYLHRVPGYAGRAAAQVGQRSRHAGRRFSAKAARPSAASSVPAVTVSMGWSSRRASSAAWSQTA